MLLTKCKNNKSYIQRAVEEDSHEEQTGTSNWKLNIENGWENIHLGKGLLYHPLCS